MEQEKKQQSLQFEFMKFISEITLKLYIVNISHACNMINTMMKHIDIHIFISKVQLICLQIT